MIRSFVIAFLSSNLAFANIVGTDAQSFNTTPSGLDFVTVQSSETLEPGIINLGLFANYAQNTFPYYESGAGNRSKFEDAMFAADFNVGVGLMPNWDFGFSVPMILHHYDTSNAGRLTIGENGQTEVRVVTKYRFWGNRDGGFALVPSINLPVIRNNPYTGDSTTPIFNLEAAWDTTIRKIALGFNFGHRWRSPGSRIVGSLIEPFGNQFVASVAASYLISGFDTKLISEIYAVKPTKTVDTNTDRQQTSAEMILGVKHDFTTSLAGHAGAGTRLIYGTASPDYRVYVGLNYTFGPIGKKPVVVLPEPVQGSSIVTLNDIKFEFDSDEIVDEGSKQQLAQFAKFLKDPPGYKKLVISGHTDSVGRAEYNLQLSQRRAQAIKNYLVKNHSLKAETIEAKGFGEDKPVADNGNFQGRRQNRRVEFDITR